MVRNACRPLLTIADYCPPLPTITDHYQRLLIIADHYLPLPTITDHYRPLPAIADQCRPLPTIAEHYRPLPTISLEPAAALSAPQVVMRAVQNICRAMHVAFICTIHQPARDLFLLFDQLVLLQRGGSLIYFGPVGREGSSLVGYLSSQPGIKPLHDGANPADWMLDEVGAGVAYDAENGEQLAAAFRDSVQYNALQQELAELMGPQSGPPLEFESKYPAKYSSQARCLLTRATRTYWRSPGYNFVRSILTLIYAVIFGVSYWRMNWTQSDIFLRLSWCYTTTFYVGLTFLISGLSVLLVWPLHQCNVYAAD